MRIAVIADVHGNIHALEAVLAEIEKQKVDKIILAGDLVNGLPSSKECLDLVNSQEIVFLRGNHERYVFDYGTKNAPESWKNENFAPVRWVRQQLSKDDLKQLKSLAMYIQFDNLLITHAAPNDDYAKIKLETAISQIDKYFLGFDGNFIIKAHNHIWLERSWGKRHLLSIGAVGLPMDGNRKAPYIIAEKQLKGWKFIKHFVDYDFIAAANSIEASGYSDYTPMALLTKQEVLTARSAVYPFIMDWARALEHNEISLKNAIYKFLS